MPLTVCSLSMNGRMNNFNASYNVMICLPLLQNPFFHQLMSVVLVAREALYSHLKMMAEQIWVKNQHPFPALHVYLLFGCWCSSFLGNISILLSIVTVSTYPLQHHKMAWTLTQISFCTEREKVRWSTLSRRFRKKDGISLSRRIEKRAEEDRKQ